MNQSQRVAAILTPGILACIGALFVDPIPQDLAYHRFADQRVIFGIPHFGDVLSNMAFILAGIIGLIQLLRHGSFKGAFLNDQERVAWIIFFSGLLLTGFGSMWYHLQPSNASLVWDRMAMTLIFTSLISAVVTDHLGIRAGLRCLSPLVVSGLISVVWWAYTEGKGRGDLRWYGLMQFYPLLASVLIITFFRSRYTHVHGYGLALGLYAAAKVAEYFDDPIYRATAWMSGHTLKHLLAAACAWPLLAMLQRRTTQPDDSLQTASPGQ